MVHPRRDVRLRDVDRSCASETIIINVATHPTSFTSSSAVSRSFYARRETFPPRSRAIGHARAFPPRTRNTRRVARVSSKVLAETEFSARSCVNVTPRVFVIRRGREATFSPVSLPSHRRSESRARCASAINSGARARRFARINGTATDIAACD